MPELPEVENIRLTISPRLLGRKIAGIEIYIGRVIKWPAVEDFAQGLSGSTITGISRRGKYLIFNLDNQRFLVVHLRMTGALIISPEQPPYSRIKFALSDGGCLWYTDVRTLGTLHLLNQGENIIKGLQTLGPEPFRGQLKRQYFAAALKNRAGSVKGVLLDQSVIAGVGNIYADEALALAGIRPDRPASGINAREITKLHQAVIKVIEQGIADRGTSFRDYKDGDGQPGEHQKHLMVYGRHGQHCRNCGNTLAYKKISGRGTTYCPSCQQ